MTASIPLNRRTAIGLSLAASLALPSMAAAKDKAGPIRALAFDGFTVFDPRSLTKAVLAIQPEKGMALASAWINKLFGLSWLETSAGRYSGFAALADAALAHSASTLSIEMSAQQRHDLVDVFHNLPAWPDAAASLERMRSAGIRLAFLSNLSAQMLSDSTRKSGLDALMEPPLSTDAVRAFKPSPKAYAMGPAYFGLPKSQVGFVAFGGWDALGAKWFGYRTAWINRLSVTPEPLEPAPDAVATDLSAALRLVSLEDKAG